MNFIKKYWIVIVVIFGLSMFIKPAACPLILGTLFVYIGFKALVFLNKISKKGVCWTGEIIDYESDSKGYKTPIVEFTTMTGTISRRRHMFIVQLI